MDKITNVQELNSAILKLENKQAEKAILLKEQFNLTYESLKPVNLVRNTLKEIVTAPDLKEDLLKTTIGVASGYLFKNIAVGSNGNPLKQILGSFLQMGVTNVVSKNVDGIKTKFTDMFKVIFK